MSVEIWDATFHMMQSPAMPEYRMALEFCRMVLEDDKFAGRETVLFGSGHNAHIYSESRGKNV